MFREPLPLSFFEARLDVIIEGIKRGLLVGANPYEAKGRTFESCRAHSIFEDLRQAL
jgi:hypothetical protein